MFHFIKNFYNTIYSKEKVYMKGYALFYVRELPYESCDTIEFFKNPVDFLTYYDADKLFLRTNSLEIVEIEALAPVKTKGFIYITNKFRVVRKFHIDEFILTAIGPNHTSFSDNLVKNYPNGALSVNAENNSRIISNKFPENTFIEFFGINNMILNLENFNKILNFGSNNRILNLANNISVMNESVHSTIITFGTNTTIIDSGISTRIVSLSPYNKIIAEGNDTTILLSGFCNKVKAKSGTKIIHTDPYTSTSNVYIVDDTTLKKNTLYRFDCNNINECYE